MQTSAEPKNLWLEVVASTEAKKKRTKRNFYRLHVNLADIKYAETIIKKTIVYTFSLPRKKFSSRYFEKKNRSWDFQARTFLLDQKRAWKFLRFHNFSKVHVLWTCKKCLREKAFVPVITNNVHSPVKIADLFDNHLISTINIY